MNQDIINSIYNLSPEITLIIGLILINIVSLYIKKETKIFFSLSLCILITSLLFTLTNIHSEPVFQFNGLLAYDPFAYFSRTLILISSIIIFINFYKTPFSHEVNLYLLFTGAALISVSSNNLILTFISLESANIALYLLLSYSKKTALKYFIYSSVLSGLMLYGFSLLYGLTGRAEYNQIANYLSFNNYNILTFSISIVLIMLGLLFKMITLPLNLIFPAISEKIKLKHTALLANIPIITGFAVITRFLFSILHDHNTYITDNNIFILTNSINWQLLLSITAVFTIIFGNFVVLWQSNIRKIFSYIVFSQTGYLLLGIASSAHEGLQASMMYLIIYLLNTTGLLCCLKILEEKLKIFDIYELAGHGKNNKLFFTIFSIFLISASGFPPAVGFAAKLLLFKSLPASLFSWVIPVSILSAIVYLYFIFKLIYSFFISKKVENTAIIETNSIITLLILLLPAIFAVYMPALLSWLYYCSKIIGN